jgi:hypothetical protein
MSFLIAILSLVLSYLTCPINAGDLNDEFKDYVRYHFFDPERHLVFRDRFSSIVNQEYMNVGFQEEDWCDENEIMNALIWECAIPEHLFAKMFPQCTYTFPWLDKDEYGFIKNSKTAVYADYSQFEVENGSFKVLHDPRETVRDRELEDAAQGLTSVLFDLKLDSNDPPLFKTNQCWVSPSSIRGTAVYDVLYYADYLFKLIWRYLSHIVFEGKPFHTVGFDFFLLAREAKDGFYHVAHTRGHPGFAALGNAVQLFFLKNKKDRLSEWRESYEQYGRSTFKANLQFPDIEYSVSGSQVYIAPLKPVVLLSNVDDSPYPENGPGWVFKTFFEDYYDKIKAAFPIYFRLERLYKIILVNRIMGGLTDSSVSSELLTYIENHVDNIAFHGGIRLQPQSWKPTRMPPRVPAFPTFPDSEHVKVVKVARKPLSFLPVAVGAIAHSGLVLETNTGRTFLLDYNRDTNVQLKEVSYSELSDWKIQEKGEILDQALTAEQIKEVMVGQTSSRSYNVHEHNCHLAQQRTRQALGLHISQPYNPL